MPRKMNLTLWALLVPALLLYATLALGRAGAQEGDSMETSDEVEILTEVVTYEDGDTPCEGFRAWRKGSDDAPVVVIFHDWMGRGAFDEGIARRLAELGYVAFSADVYGSGLRPANVQEAREATSRWYADRAALRRRVNAALAAARGEGHRPAAAIGYCFGGTCALELARSGADLRGVVSFHGGLTTGEPARAETLKARLLVLHGADDPFVPEADVSKFMTEMREAKADWQLVAYGNAVHSFTNPAAGDDNSRGAAYNAAADRRSWRAMRAFFEEILP
jgi:dienelactone hydrolase